MIGRSQHHASVTLLETVVVACRIAALVMLAWFGATAGAMAQSADCTAINTYWSMGRTANVYPAAPVYGIYSNLMPGESITYRGKSRNSTNPQIDVYSARFEIYVTADHTRTVFEKSGLFNEFDVSGTFAVTDPFLEISASGGSNGGGVVDVWATCTPLPPTITGLDAQFGPPVGGNAIVISGSNFSGTTSVMFGGTPATSFTVDSFTQITAVVPAGVQGSVDVQVTAAGGTSSNETSDDYTYFSQPFLVGLNPASGPEGGGNDVVISGDNLGSASSVLFDGVAASFIVDSGTQITANVPAHGAGAGHVEVVNPDGASTTSAASLYTWIAAPVVTGLDVVLGPPVGGTRVVVTGTGFGSATSVRFGNTPATSFTVDNDSQITAIAPAGSPGTVDVQVTAAGGTSSNGTSNDYTYSAQPFLMGLSPSSGPAGGGNDVVITGEGLGSATSVLFDGVAASFFVRSATQIIANAPTHGAGVGHVEVVNPDGISTTSATSLYTWIAAPVLTGLDVTMGPVSGGTTVVLTGTGFSGATSVTFDGRAASFTVDSDTQITAVSPSAGIAGDIVLAVVAPGGFVSSAFTYVAAPTLSLVSPSVGPISGGSPVYIVGTNLETTSSVTFGGVPVAFTVDSGTQISTQIPPGSRGPAEVLVTTVGGTAGSIMYTYFAPPTVTALSPANGPLAGGTTVVLTGTNFDGTTAVTFGATPASSYTVVSPTEINAVAPAGAAGQIHVRVTTPGGTSATAPGNLYGYARQPTVTGISPSPMSNWGGQLAVITGTDLETTSAVTIGGGSAYVYSIDSPTQIRVSVPPGAAGPADVVVTTAGGTSTLSGQFSYFQAPVITGLLQRPVRRAGATRSPYPASDSRPSLPKTMSRSMVST